MNKIETAYEIHEIVYRHYIVSSTGDGAWDSVHTIPLEEPLFVQHTQAVGTETSPILVNEMLNRLHSGILERMVSDERKQRT